MAETLESGARVSEIARRWQVCPQQIFGWRREARHEPKALAQEQPGSAPSPCFVPIVAGPRASATARRAAAAAPVIEVRLAGAVIRVVAGSDDGTQLATVLRAVRASATGT